MHGELTAGKLYFFDGDKISNSLDITMGFFTDGELSENSASRRRKAMYSFENVSCTDNTMNTTDFVI